MLWRAVAVGTILVVMRSWCAPDAFAPSSSPSRRVQSKIGRQAGPAKETETVTIEMKAPLDGRVGVAIQSGRRTVSRLAHKEASSLGWRVGDVILEVNGSPVKDNEAVKAAVRQALADHEATGNAMSFVVKRLKTPIDKSRSMLRMTPGTGGELTMSMVDLTQSLLGDFQVVLFMEGTLKEPQANLSASVVRALLQSGLAFKAVDCLDEKYNPGVQKAVEALSGEAQLPQLFAGGRRLGNGNDVLGLSKTGDLATKLRELGAVDAEATG